MPANLTPQYNEAEHEYKQARTPEDKLAALKKMLQLMPKHKGTEKLQADLKSRMKELREELEHEKKTGGKKSAAGHKIIKQGAGQVVILGGPNVGKSRLLTRLTNATPEVAAYPFTTREPHPGMMAWQDVFVQLVDTPPITRDFMEGYLQGLVRGADAAILMVDLADDDGASAADDVIQRLAQTKTMLVGQLPAASENSGTQSIKTMLVANKIDEPGAAERLEFLKEFFTDRFPLHVVSAEHGQGLEELRDAIYAFLNVIRVYTKEPGKPPDMSAPFTIPFGGTVVDLAAKVHRDFVDKLKSARIWGTGVYDGQSVKRDHVLHDKDVVELHV